MNDQRIIAYLLEELSPEEAARFEEECFEAEQWPDEIGLAEEELIEDYLRGELSPARRERFRLHYLTTPARRERVRVAAALLRQAEAEASADAGDEAAEAEPAAGVATTTSPTFFERLRAFWGGNVWASRALAASLVLALVVAAWMWMPGGRPANLLAVTLTASRSERGDGALPARVSLRGYDALGVTLPLPEGVGPAESYQVEMEDERGGVTTLEPAVPDGREVRVVIPASQLARGAYVLKLYAVGAGPARRVGNYFLSVE